MITYCMCNYPECDFSRMPIRCKHCGRVVLPSIIYAEQENRQLTHLAKILFILLATLTLAYLYLAWQVKP